VSKLKRDQRAMRPINRRNGFYIHLVLFVVFAIFMPADWYLRVVGLILHFIAPYIWHVLFKGRRDERYNPLTYNSGNFWSDVHLGTYLATMTMLWANVTISLANLEFFWNPSLFTLTLVWGVLVWLHRFVVDLMKERDAAQERVQELETALDEKIARLAESRLDDEVYMEDSALEQEEMN